MNNENKLEEESGMRYLYINAIRNYVDVEDKSETTDSAARLALKCTSTVVELPAIPYT